MFHRGGEPNEWMNGKLDDNATRIDELERTLLEADADRGVLIHRVGRNTLLPYIPQNQVRVNQLPPYGSVIRG